MMVKLQDFMFRFDTVSHIRRVLSVRNTIKQCNQSYIICLFNTDETLTVHVMLSQLPSLT